MKIVKITFLAALMLGAVAPAQAEFYQYVGSKLTALSKNLKELIPAFAGGVAGFAIGYSLKKRELAQAFEQDKSFLRAVKDTASRNGGLDISHYINNKMIIANETEKTALLDAIEAHNSLVSDAAKAMAVAKIKSDKKYLIEQIDDLLAKEPKVKHTQVSDWWWIGGATASILAMSAYKDWLTHKDWFTHAKGARA